MNRFAIFLIIALLVAATVGAARADTTYIPAISGGAQVTPTVTPDFSTATNTPTVTQTGEATGTATTTSTPTQTPTVTATATEQSQSGPCPCVSDSLNCSDFSTEPEAQACMDWCVSQGQGDIHNLDGNANGTACESLPGNFKVVR